jgi:hypothetical protein
LLGGFAPDFIVGSGGVFRSVRAIAPRSEEEKFFCVCVGGREERRNEEKKEREDVDEGRSGDWLAGNRRN